MRQNDESLPERALTITVLIPTYRRPADLARCLAALERQSRLPDEVLVVCRDTDSETHAFLAGRVFGFPFRTVEVRAGGQIAALNTGLDAVTTDIVAITDDDSAPRTEWLCNIERHFMQDATVGGVGGRDYVAGEPVTRESAEVGKIAWFGRLIGNHHIGIGPPRYVHVLKGVNMSYRREAIGDVRFDARLRGTGAQVHNELAFCCAIREKGWRLMYDPAVAVDHYPAQRFDEDQRSSGALLATRNAAYNQTLGLLHYLQPLARPVFFLWALGVGTRALPGLLRSLAFPARHRGRWQRLQAVFDGRVDALKTHLARHG